jgi:hypothetical protein
MVTKRKGADVGMRFGEDFRRGARLDEFDQHLATQVAGVLDLAVELAVGKRACAAFAELHIRFRVQNAASPKAPGVLGPLTDHLAPVQDKGTKAHLRQDQACEQTARPGADHHRSRTDRLRRAADEPIVGVRRGLNPRIVPQPRQRRRLLPQTHIDRVDHEDRGFASRVMSPPNHRVVDQIVRMRAEPLENGGGDGFGRVAQGQLQVRQTQHDGLLTASGLNTPPVCYWARPRTYQICTRSWGAR